jgi:hypothetical protein
MRDRPVRWGCSTVPNNPQFLVVPRGRGWVIRSGPVPLRWFPTKHQALSFGVRCASRNRPSELTVRSPDGSVEERRVYAATSAAS